MFIAIETTEGNLELANKDNISKVFMLKSGDLRVNMVNGDYIVTSMNFQDLAELLR